MPSSRPAVKIKNGGMEKDTKKKKEGETTITTPTATTTSNNIIIEPQQPFTLNPKTWKCWAHSIHGRRCTSFVKIRNGEPIPVPYCDKHLSSGDGALKVVNHGLLGKCLIARYTLPSKYRLVYHGPRGKCHNCYKEDRAISFYPPNSKSGKNKDPNNGNKTNVTNNYNGVLNPDGTGCMVQFSSCPGPNERQNMRSTFNYWGKRNGNYGGLEFKTIEVIPQNAQLCFWYGPGWWSARGVKRLDVGTVKHPAPLRVLVCNNQAKKNSEKDTTNVTNGKKQKAKKKTKSATGTSVGSTTARKKRKVAA